MNADTKNTLIETNGSFARSCCSVIPLLATLLTARALSFEPAGPLGHERRSQLLRYYKIDKEGVVWFPAFVVPELVQQLKAAGFQVTVVGHWHKVELLDADHSFRDHLAPQDQAILDAMQARPRGVVEVPNTDQLVRYIELLCRYHPTWRMFIAAATRRQVKLLYRKLRDRLGDKIKTAEQWTWRIEDRIHLGTLDLLSNCQPFDWDLIILTDALQAIGKKHTGTIKPNGDMLPGIFGTFAERRIVSFIRAGTRLGDVRRLRLLSLCGPIIHTALPTHGDVVVVWSTPPWISPVPAATALERKREAIWHNDQRNAHVAAIARAFAGGKMEALWELGLLLHDDHQAILANDQPLALSILVESIEHGRELLRRLPGWQLLSGQNPGRLGKEAPSNAAAPTAAGNPSNLILMSVRAASMQVLATDVLIRADGSEGPLPVHDWVSVSLEAGILVDFADDTDSAACRAGRRRQEDYQRRHWRIDTVPRWFTSAHDDQPGTSRRRACSMSEATARLPPHETAIAGQVVREGDRIV